MAQRLKKRYFEKIVPYLKEQFHYKNNFQVPRIDKIVINRGVGDASQNNKMLESYLTELSVIAGQRGVITRSKKAIAGFKLRQQMPVGVSVTIRGEKMYGFLDRLINLALPRIRDFQGVSPTSFDGQGNFSLGLEEQLVFPEVNYDKIEQSRGMDISIITTSRNDQEGLSLLKEFGMPFRGK